MGVCSVIWWSMVGARSPSLYYSAHGYTCPLWWCGVQNDLQYRGRCCCLCRSSVWVLKVLLMCCYSPTAQCNLLSLPTSTTAALNAAQDINTHVCSVE